MTQLRIPGSKGLPVLGESLAVIDDPYQFAHGHIARYGPVFATNIQGKTTVAMVSAAAQEYVLGTHHRNFLASAGYGYLNDFLGGALLLQDGPTHIRQRRLLAPAFRQHNMAAYLATMNRFIDGQLATWGAQGQRALYDEMRQLTFKLASALLLGIEPGPTYDQLIHLWVDYARGLFAIVKVDTPFTIYGRALQAQRHIEQLVRTTIAQRRGQPTSDALGLLINAHDEQEGQLTDEELISQTKLLIFAGYDTTSGTLTWLMTELLQQPALLERVRVAVRADDRDAPVTLDDLRDKPFLDALVDETLRLHPQQPLMLRGTVDPFDFGGFTITAGTPVMLLPAYTHRDPAYFADPERFNPDRFLAPQAEAQRTPYAWVGFGNGPHICLGEGIARLEIKAMLTRLLRCFDLALVGTPNLHPRFLPTNRPKGPVTVAYTAR
ncbi:MAG: cytochrome P450 [Ktedonobacterales bacterium]|nr:cytochrome P450 [Ktedonobacterales bacterium]